MNEKRRNKMAQKFFTREMYKKLLEIKGIGKVKATGIIEIVKELKEV